MPLDLAEECPLIALLLALEREGMLTANRLGEKTGLSPQTAAKARDRGREAGILIVTELPSDRANRVQEIRLPPRTAQAAALLGQARALLLGDADAPPA